MGEGRIKLSRKIIVYLFLTLILVIMLFPLIYVIASSFKTNVEIVANPERVFPEHWTFDNYVSAWTSDVMRVGQMFFNSVWFTVASVAITLLTSSVTGYVFERGEFKLKKLIFAVFSSLMFISLGSITIYPQFEVLSLLNLNKSLVGLLVITCFGIPIVNMYLVKSFVGALPREMDESAKIDGCTFTGIFFRIILPLLKPILATIAIISFKTVGNDYLLPTLVLDIKSYKTIPMLIQYFRGSYGKVEMGPMMASIMLTVIPIVIVYLVGQKHIIKGVAAGAVKG